MRVREQKKKKKRMLAASAELVARAGAKRRNHTHSKSTREKTASEGGTQRPRHPAIWANTRWCAGGSRSRAAQPHPLRRAPPPSTRHEPLAIKCRRRARRRRRRRPGPPLPQPPLAEKWLTTRTVSVSGRSNTLFPGLHNFCSTSDRYSSCKTKKKKKVEKNRKKR